MTIHAIERMKESGFGGNAIIGAFAPQVIGKKGYDYILGKESGVHSIRIFLKKLALEATEAEMKEMLEAVKQESNVIKGTISEFEFEHIARSVLAKRAQ